ncbi:MAG TPA: COX aromatic rich motif-containing protein [Candidatus Saccharimonadales bacterium]|nr:COX aromatic rich motif-containing protein [Candidatus Saccharimonadales bacterium]
MKKHLKLWLGIVLLLAIVGGTSMLLRGHTVSILQPVGEIGQKEKNLITFTVLLSLVVVIPVFILLGYIAWHYREGNTRAKYSPNLEGSAVAETIWWLIPTALLVIISVVNWRSSYALDPFKPLSSSKPTLHIQVVALDWKWLFIYPDQHIARVNVVDIPVGTPVDFEITSDTVMTSFWAPQLGGQMYAMPGMSTHLNLVAAKAGNYDGVAANISGKGFADMKFTVHALPPDIYGDWLQIMHRLPKHLTASDYANLARPSVITQPNEFNNGYSTVDPTLYDTIVMKYMMPLTPAPLHEHGTEPAGGTAL